MVGWWTEWLFGGQNSSQNKGSHMTGGQNSGGTYMVGGDSGD